MADEKPNGESPASPPVDSATKDTLFEELVGGQAGNGRVDEQAASKTEAKSKAEEEVQEVEPISEETESNPQETFEKWLVTQDWKDPDFRGRMANFVSHLYESFPGIEKLPQQDILDTLTPGDKAAFLEFIKDESDPQSVAMRVWRDRENAKLATEMRDTFARNTNLLTQQAVGVLTLAEQNQIKLTDAQVQEVLELTMNSNGKISTAMAFKALHGGTVDNRAKEAAIKARAEKSAKLKKSVPGGIRQLVTEKPGGSNGTIDETEENYRKAFGVSESKWTEHRAALGR